MTKTASHNSVPFRASTGDRGSFNSKRQTISARNRPAAASNRWMIVMAVLLVGFAGGCGKSHTPLASITGNVSYRGQPLAQGTIIFASSHRTASGKIVNGKIVDVTTYRQNDGAPIGAHQIAVQASTSRDDAAVASHPRAVSATDGYMGVGKSPIPTRYRDPKTSGLTCEVKPGNNELNLELTD